MDWFHRTWPGLAIVVTTLAAPGLVWLSRRLMQAKNGQRSGQTTRARAVAITLGALSALLVVGGIAVGIAVLVACKS